MPRIIPVYEKVIQDEVSRPECLKEMLAQLAERRLLDSSEWEFDPDEEDGDIVNQEYAIGVGAVDVIATFNKRQKVLIAETKWGEATSADLGQLQGYLAVLRADQEVIRKTDPSMANADLDGVIGLLIGQAFPGITSDDLRLAPGMHLFRCEFSGPEHPPTFAYVPPDRLPASPTSVPPNRSRRSCLVRLRDHTAGLGPELHPAFTEFTRCFLEPDDPRYRWVYVNVKDGHVWVRYRGTGVVCLVVRGPNALECCGCVNAVISRESWDAIRGDFRQKIQSTLIEEDEKYRKHFA